jgi:large subunit ribosomal protein L23
MEPRDVILEPVVSEKSYSLLDEGAYTFKVHPDANKIQIRQAVESIFDVRVLKVTTANRKGKRKRNRRAMTFGRRADTKRAIVTLVEGDTIDLFEG